jgi:hypothetical protein
VCSYENFVENRSFVANAKVRALIYVLTICSDFCFDSVSGALHFGGLKFLVENEYVAQWKK